MSPIPEPPDFKKIAEYWCFNEETDDVPEMDARRAEFVIVLKSIWNARGAADVATIDDYMSGFADPELMAAIKGLDR